MRSIVKRPEPASLTTHRRNPHGNYDNYADKDALRAALVAEQRGLCCYCMCRIVSEANAMKIEHWRSRNAHSGEELDYQNLLAACRGSEGQPLSLQHCDTRKGDGGLRWNPADRRRRIEDRISYASDGTIQSDDPVFDEELNDVLNLNLPRIRNHRRAILDAVLLWWQRQRRPVPRQRVEREVERRSTPQLLDPYVQVGIWWLERKLARPSGGRRRRSPAD